MTTIVPKTVSMVMPCYFKDVELVEMTKLALESIGDEKPTEIILVDDASPLHPVIEGVTYIRRKTNGRFPKAVNTGLKHTTGDVIVVANNDIIFYPGWLEGLLKGLERYDIASIRVSDSDGWNTEELFTENDRFGSLWAMSRKVYETIGGLDTDFKLGAFEDLDYYNRAKKAGFDIGKYHGALVEHIGRATNSKEFPNYEDFTSSKEVYIKKYGQVD